MSSLRSWLCVGYMSSWTHKHCDARTCLGPFVPVKQLNPKATSETDSEVQVYSTVMWLVNGIRLGATQTS